MKKIKRWLLLLGCIFVLSGLCSCQKMETMQIDTQLNIDSNFDGERVMTAVMPKSVLDTLFDGDTEVLRNTIEKYCPPELGCSVSLSGGDVQIRLVIPFASLSEYKTKVFRILVNDKNPDRDSVDPSVYFDAADTIFKNGFTIEESFSSADMFYWIIAAVKEEFPKFADEDLTHLYESGKTVFVYNGREIETEDHIRYSEMESASFRKVHVYAELDDSADIYTGQVSLTILRDDYDKLKNYNLNDRMNKLLTPDMSMTTGMTNNEKTYRITFSATSLSQFESYLNKIFDSAESEIEIIQDKTDDEALKARKYVTLYVDSGNYIDFSREDAEVVYTFKVNGSYTLEDCQSAGNYMTKTRFDATDAVSTAEITMDADDEITLVLGTDVAVDRLDVYTRVYSQYKLERSIAFYLSDSKEQLIGEGLEDKINERLNSLTTFEKEATGDGMTEYLVTMHADSGEQLADLTCAFLDGDAASGRSVFDGGLGDKNHLRKIQMNYTDKMDFSGFLGGSNVENGISYTLEYPKGYEGYFNDASEYEQVSEGSHILSCTTRNKTLSIGSWAQKTNWNGIAQMFLWYLSLAVMLVLVLVHIPLIIRCVRTKNVNWTDIGLFTRKGYTIVTIFTVAGVIFVITGIRLLFQVY